MIAMTCPAQPLTVEGTTKGGDQVKGPVIAILHRLADEHGVVTGGAEPLTAYLVCDVSLAAPAWIVSENVTANTVEGVPV